MLLRIGLPILFLILSFSNTYARTNAPADTISVTLAEEEKAFVERNFMLLAAKYQINEADAAIIQAKLYPNINFSIDQGVYNPGNKKWFDFTQTGETAISLQQLILLGGKRKNQIKMAKINSQISTYEFYDMLRSLRYELRTSFYGLYFLKQSLVVYDREIGSLQSLITAYQDQYNKGNIAFKELARLQALRFSLENERLDILKDAGEKQSNLSLLTGDTLLHPVNPIVDSAYIEHIDAASLNYVQVMDSGLNNRYDLQVARTKVNLYQANLSYQKAMGVPDLTLGAHWDRQGSYIANYNSLSLAIDLPFWNHNQGNIKVAKYQIKENVELQSQEELTVKSDINKAYQHLVETDKMYKSSNGQFNSDYAKLLDGITKGYQNHTISLLEFIDYYETYKDSKVEFNRLQNSRLDALENLNLATGSTLLK